MSKISVFAASAAALIAGQAAAGDYGYAERCFDKGTLSYVDCPGYIELLPVVTPTPVMGPYDWSGYTLGAFVGYGTGDGDHGKIDDSLGFLNEDAFGLDVDGGVFGLEIGADHDFGGFVLGVAADIAMSSIDGFDFNTLDDDGYETEIDWLGTLRAKAGFALDNVLIYGTGGLAYGGVEAVQGDIDGAGAFDPATGVATYDDAVLGYAVGGGLSFGLTEDVVIGAEYLFVDLSEELDSDTNSIGSGTSTYDIDAQLHIGKISLKAKF